ncbi:HAMP domain-containing sensor histidine kinase [Corynebacterium striatum]|uniref:HAMP domain-containing sensor histidine kinase n=2 Tax=Corynebacterium striatum TaxID=43770 RepID=UPI001A1A11EE|nr:HAMP domain-containing sensor histidine kinase [Corynebacterium striatum]MCG7249023.1 HAMP domain-containing histidine kinase [Corynebacterium striatum]HAT1153310.1 HAMP domain-containing histidine kinase [Corynebacterium striatum]HAT1170394.1 HAMP domain-containing histidine kinase [Corynebacterium striatum]HAT1175611.1 HAMP domain-containing histidine kinase [Corynebacterium striatum]HAT1254018.1 HAMP domain-containing histidine kinase [Corynebacterium striatum]
MILRKPTPGVEASDQEQPSPVSEIAGSRGSWASRAPLRWRLSLVTGLVVAVSVALMTLVTYWTVSTSLTATVDKQLAQQADVLIQQSQDPRFIETIDQEIAQFKLYNPSTRVAVSSPSRSSTYGDAIPVGGEFRKIDDHTESSVRTVGGERILAMRHDSGLTVVLARDLAEAKELISAIGSMLLVIVALGVLLAIFAGMVASKTGMQPISRLKRAVDYVTQTNDLRPIEVVNNDEMAQLTVSFNQMLEALQQSRVQQRQFVTDAGHELKTPLTSMRTNIELLLMMNKSGGGCGISEKDRRDLEDDVMSQMSELSALIGDLVDLARGDANEKAPEPVALMEVLESSLARARRRRPDVKFRVRFIPWVLEGDPFALGRATLNLMDNAAKWSPATGTVRVSMQQISEHEVRLRVDDSGPGIPPEEREKVFERFYRSAEARSMPGSGLGLAIVKSVIERHEGAIEIKESSDGGTRMEVTLPGYRGEGDPFVDSLSEPDFAQEESSPSDRGTIFAERWFNQG